MTTPLTRRLSAIKAKLSSKSTQDDYYVPSIAYNQMPMMPMVASAPAPAPGKQQLTQTRSDRRAVVDDAGRGAVQSPIRPRARNDEASEIARLRRALLEKDRQFDDFSMTRQKIESLETENAELRDRVQSHVDVNKRRSQLVMSELKRRVTPLEQENEALRVRVETVEDEKREEARRHVVEKVELEHRVADAEERATQFQGACGRLGEQMKVEMDSHEAQAEKYKKEIEQLKADDEDRLRKYRKVLQRLIDNRRLVAALNIDTAWLTGEVNKAREEANQPVRLSNFFAQKEDLSESKLEKVVAKGLVKEKRRRAETAPPPMPRAGPNTRPPPRPVTPTPYSTPVSSPRRPGPSTRQPPARPVAPTPYSTPMSSRVFRA